MAAGTYNFLAEQGADLDLVLTYTDSSGALVNLTGYTADMQVRATVDSNTVVLELTTENNRIIMGGSTGKITLSVGHAIMSAIPAGTYVYDLEITSGGGKVTRLIEGKFVVKPEVTRTT